MGSSDVESYSAEAVTAMLLFSAASSSLLIINKLCLHALPLPSFVSTAQFVVCAATAFILMGVGCVPTDRFEWHKVKPYCYYVCMFVATIYCNMRALQHSNVETVIVFRSCCPLIVAMLDWAFLGRKLPSARSFASLLVILGGCLGYVLTDRSFRMNGIAAYTWVSAYFLIISVEMAYGKHIVGPHLGFASMWGPTLYTNSISILPMLTIGLGTKEHVRLAAAHWTTGSVSLLLLSCAIGVAISYLGFRARSLVTATCYTVLGVANKMVTVAVNAIIWDKHASLLGIIFLVVCLAGATGYQQAPLADAAQQSPSAQSSVSTSRAAPPRYGVSPGRWTLALALGSIVLLAACGYALMPRLFACVPTACALGGLGASSASNAAAVRAMHGLLHPAQCLSTQTAWINGSSVATTSYLGWRSTRASTTALDSGSKGGRDARDGMLRAHDLTVGNELQEYVRAYSQALSTRSVFVGDPRQSSRPVSETCYGQFHPPISCFLLAPPSEPCPEPTTPSSAQPAIRIVSSPVESNLAFAAAVPALRAATTAWIMAHLSTHVLRPTAPAAKYACLQMASIGWKTSPSGALGCRVPKGVLGAAVRLSPGHATGVGTHGGGGGAAAIDGTGRGGLLSLDLAPRTVNRIARLMAYAGTSRVLLIPLLPTSFTHANSRTEAAPSSIDVAAAAAITRGCALARSALITTLTRQMRHYANGTRSFLHRTPADRVSLERRVACLPPQPGADGGHASSAAGASATAATSASATATSHASQGGSPSAGAHAEVAPTSMTDGALVPPWSPTLFYLSAAWHLAYADAFAGSVATDFGRTVHELMHAQSAEIGGDGTWGLPRVFDVEGGSEIYTMSAPTERPTREERKQEVGARKAETAMRKQEERKQEAVARKAETIMRKHRDAGNSNPPILGADEVPLSLSKSSMVRADGAAKNTSFHGSKWSKTWKQRSTGSAKHEKQALLSQKQALLSQKAKGTRVA